GKPFLPTGRTLREIEEIDFSGRFPALDETEITVMCDIDNPLYGKSGAAYVFAPQKGVREGEIEMLDEGLRHLASLCGSVKGVRAEDLPGAGAAGGMGFGSVVFLGGQLKMGIETVLDTVGFDSLLPGTDLVVTGEGKLDKQSLRGKVVIGVSRRAKKQGVPVAALVGDIGDGYEKAYEEGVTGIFSTNRLAIPFSEAKKRAGEDLRATADNLMRFCRTMGL
ncbi:MAG: glycerate kinase, partial [Clostridia bacterium]|nr:glycerate kinase [Clostridia bacterium]